MKRRTKKLLMYALALLGAAAVGATLMHGVDGIDALDGAVDGKFPGY